MRSTTLSMAALAGALTVGGGAWSLAQATATAQASMAAPQPSAAAIRFSDDGFRAARAVRLARMEIFNGQPQAAGTLLTSATDAIRSAERDGRTAYANLRPRGAATAVSPDTLWVPVDGRMFLSDDFVATPEKQAHIAAANEHLRRGDRAKAMEELRLAEVDVGMTRVLMPLGPTGAHIATAQDLIRQGKFYEANLALKAAEDGMVSDTEMLITRPAAKPRR